MKKIMKIITKTLFYLSKVIFVLSGILSGIIEYFIWDQSILPDFLDNFILIVWCSSMAYIGIYIYVTKSKF